MILTAKRPKPALSLDMDLRNIIVPVYIAMALVLLAAACGGGTSPAANTNPRTQVVTTTAILADMVENVGGDRVEVRSIVPPGVDAHSFHSRPGDSIALSNARLVVSNGAGLDAFLDPLLKSAKGAGTVHVVAAEGLRTSAPGGTESAGDEAHDGRRGAWGDPHFWQNPLYAIYYIERIRDGLVQADPASSRVYRDNAAEYMQKLRDLDQEIARTLSVVPPQRRHLVTFHDAFGHFAKRYDWRVSAFVVSDASDVHPRTVVEVLERIKDEDIRIVFAEPQFSADVLGQAAKDAGIVVGRIYSDTLDDQVPTYIDMMRFNAKSLSRLQQ